MPKETNSLIKTKGRNGFPVVLAGVILLLALGGGGFLLFRDTAPPTISFSPETIDIGKSGRIVVTVEDLGSGLDHVEIAVMQNGERVVHIAAPHPGTPNTVAEEIALDASPMSEGPFTVAVNAKDASLYPFGAKGAASLEKTYTLDATPPSIYVKTHTNNLNQGGAGFLVYALSEPAAETGIRVGERFFPAYLQPGDDNLYHCMFAHPWDIPAAEFKPVILAADAVGNEAKRTFNFHSNAKKFRRDQIRVSDAFMERVLPEFRELVPEEGTNLDQYMHINNQIRVANRAQLVEFSRQTQPVMLWRGIFKRLPNAANKAGFADSRDYMYKGKKVDYQTHLGIDLASVKHAPVPSGNDGVVIFADFLGIYGNVVVVDHGLGLQTLYAHLSAVSVNAGETVTKGQIVGNTGTSGLAGGDHLHYGVIISGTPVQPVEWWDASWIRNNITSKLEQ